MGFLSYSLRFYRAELQTLARTPAGPDSVYRARQLLRMLDDLADEGYTGLNEALERDCSGVSRLRDYLKLHHAAPFSVPENRLRAEALPYFPQEAELRCAIAQAMQAAAVLPEAAPLPFADRLRRFCRWIGRDDGTAYIYLLRDTLLPFVYAFSHGQTRSYPWLLSRSSFAALTGQPHADDAVRASIYRALEAGCTDYTAFCCFVLPEMRETIGRYPQAARLLASMLEGIDAERIVVVESGCAGTFPLLLMSLDARVELRMYTAYPYLTGVYGARVFTSRYEENRMFETMAAQALYFRFSGIRDGKFYVQKCADAAVEQQALTEIRTMLSGHENN